MKKLIALLLAVMMVVALCACGDTAEEPTTEAPAVEAAPAAAPEAPAAPEAAPAADLEGYKAYATAYAEAGAPTEDEKANATAAIAACTTAEEVEACAYLTPMFSNEIILTYDAWVEAGAPAADTSNMSMGDPSASGEPSGEPSAEPAA